MKKIALIVLGTLLCTLVLEANKIPGYVPPEAKKKVKKPEIYHALWEKMYGGKDDDIAYGIVALEEGESAMVGTCKSFNAQNTDICVTRLNAQGEMKWRLLLGGAKKDEGKAISRAADGTLMILGTTKSLAKKYDSDLYVAKVSLEGKLIWEKGIGGDRDEFAGGIAGTDDGGVLVVGDSESFGNHYKDIYIVKLSKEGEVHSSRTIGGEKEDSAKALTRTKDGNMVMVGHREVESSGNKDFFVMKLNQNGQKIWAKTYGGKYADTLSGVTASIDGGIVATGKTRSFGSDQTDLSVMKFDMQGELVWHKIYGFKYYEYGNAVTSTLDGGFMIAGGTNTLGNGGHSVYMLALDKNGKLIWSHVYGDREKDRAHSIARMSDGTIIVAGESDSYSRSTNFYMIKIKKK
ncbi:MAG: hypothetical protein DRG09_01375 [Epsilonproteobacteria bacterium]|nr:MAG: hypothetical protein DRG09_01375 [Campylobacterota bacterium]